MERLAKVYMEKNPQGRQVSGRTASERDVERWKLDEVGGIEGTL